MSLKYPTYSSNYSQFLVFYTYSTVFLILFSLYIFHLHDFSYTARDNRANIAVIAVNRAIIAVKPRNRRVLNSNFWM